jgi:hypothetical protein
MRVLVACEFSGTVREAFKRRGHDAWSCDFGPTEIEGNHIQDDVSDVIYDGWDLMIAHPPCKFLCNSGVRWLLPGGLVNWSRWEHMERAAYFFKKLLNAPIPKIAVENPIMHMDALKIVGTCYSQIIQPWMFGHGQTKATCLWLKNLPILKPTKIVEGREHYVHEVFYLNKYDRWRERSRTFQGIARAMSEQWG